MTELKETKGKIRIEGLIVGFDPEVEKSYRKGINKRGNEYHSLSLSVKTSSTNTINNINLYGDIPDKKVKVYSNTNGEKRKLEIDFDDRNNIPDDFTCFGWGTTRTGFESVEVDGKSRTKITNYFNYDAVQIIKDTISNDKSVWIDAEFDVNTFVTNGEQKSTVKYRIVGIGFLAKEINFNQENFKEVNSFEHEIVVVDHNLVKETNRLQTIGKIINFQKNVDTITFMTDTENYQKLAENIKKMTKFGDVIKIQGKIINEKTEEEVTEMVGFNWGGEAVAGLGGKKQNKWVSELRIVNVMSHTPKVYRDSDFIVGNQNNFQSQKVEEEKGLWD